MKEMKIVLVKSIEHDYTSIWEHGEMPEGYIIVSNPINVEFEMLPESDLVNAEVESLKEAKRDVFAKAQIRANAIEDKIQSLLAITDQS